MENNNDIKNISVSIIDAIFNEASDTLISFIDKEKCIDRDLLVYNIKKIIQNNISDYIDGQIRDNFLKFIQDNMKKCVDELTDNVINSSNMVYTEENIDNLLETLSLELMTSYPFLNLEFVDFNSSKFQRKRSRDGYTPILESYQCIEAANNILPHNPLVVRLDYFGLILSSQLIDSLISPDWPVLQKSLLLNLSDENRDIFYYCLKVHSKLMSNTSPEGCKEGFLNVAESLCQNYYSLDIDKVEGIDLKNGTVYRMVRLCDILLSCIRMITNHQFPRFGEKRIIEIIDNFIPLFYLHYNLDDFKCSSGLSIFDIICCLDLEANWFKHLSHNVMGRKNLILKVSQNCNILRISIEEIIKQIYDKSRFMENIFHLTTADTINIQCLNLSKFLHSLSLISQICKFENGRNLFPVMLKNNAYKEIIHIHDIIKIVLNLLNRQFIMGNKSDRFYNTKVYIMIIDCLKNLISYLDNSNYNLINILNVLYEPVCKHFTADDIPLHVLIILNFLSDLPKGPYDYFFKYHDIRNTPIDSYVVLTWHNKIAYRNRSSLDLRKDEVDVFRGNHQEIHFSRNIEQLPYNNEENQNSFCPVILLVDTLIDLLVNKLLNNRSKEMIKLLLNICSNLFGTHEGVLILDPVKTCSLIDAVVLNYINISAATEIASIAEQDMCELLSDIENFFINLGSTPSGFNLFISEENRLALFLHEYTKRQYIWPLIHPVADNHHPKWKSFLTSAILTKGEAVSVIAKEFKDTIIKAILSNLWNALNDSFVSNSDVIINETFNSAMNLFSIFASTHKGCMLIFDEVCEDGIVEEYDNRSETTLTEEWKEDSQCLESIRNLITEYAFNVDTYNYHMSEISLSILNLFISNLDSMLYLETKLKLQSKLLLLQSTDLIEDDPIPQNIIIDECSLLRHEILERANSIGVNNCKKLTKLYHQCPPIEPTGDSISRSKTEDQSDSTSTNLFIEFITESKLGLCDSNWLKQARKAFSLAINDDILQPCDSLIELSERVFEFNCNNNDWWDADNVLELNRDGIIWCSIDDACQLVVLLPEELYGIQLTIRYGVQKRLLPADAVSKTSQDLADLIKITRLSLLGRDRLPQQYNGFDWFLASAFLISAGNIQRCQRLLSTLSRLPSIIFIWDQYAASLNYSTDDFGHKLEILAKYEVPRSFSALQAKGISWWHLCKHWGIKECFWRVLDWNQICSWLFLCILHQPDYLLYFFVSMLHDTEDRILNDYNDGTLWKLYTNPPDKYNIADNLFYIDELYKKYHIKIKSGLTIEM